MKLDVHLDTPTGPVLVGNVFFARNRGRISSTFFYDTAYLASGLPAIDPALPLVTGSQHSPGLIRAFSDTAPDRWGRNLIDKQERARARAAGTVPRSLDDVDYLVGVSDLTRQGALRFVASNAGATGGTRPTAPDFLGPGATVPKLIELPALLHASDDVAIGDDTPAALKQLLETGTTGLGGARPKASVRLDDGRLGLVKFPHPSDAWDVIAWEALTLDLMEAAGITVPRHISTRIGGRTVLVVRRFDRAGAHDAAHRLPYISALTALGLADGEGTDYLDLAAVIRDTSSDVKADLGELYARATFNVLFGNTDDHARNHGFVGSWQGIDEAGTRRGATCTWAGWRLSPVFDVNPNPQLAARRATSIAGATEWRDEAEGLRLLASECDLDDAAAAGIRGKILEATADWRRRAAAHDLPHREVVEFAETLDARRARLSAED